MGGVILVTVVLAVIFGLGWVCRYDPGYDPASNQD